MPAIGQADKVANEGNQTCVSSECQQVTVSLHKQGMDDEEARGKRAYCWLHLPELLRLHLRFLVPVITHIHSAAVHNKFGSFRQGIGKSAWSIEDMDLKRLPDLLALGCQSAVQATISYSNKMVLVGCTVNIVLPLDRQLDQWSGQKRLGSRPEKQLLHWLKRCPAQCNDMSSLAPSSL